MEEGWPLQFRQHFYNVEVFYLKKLCLFTFSALIFWEEVYNLHANSTALASVSVLGDAPHVGEWYALLQSAQNYMHCERTFLDFFILFGYAKGNLKQKKKHR